MKRLAAVLIFFAVSIMMFTPLVLADWFGIGEAISGVADAGARGTEAVMEAKWKIELIRAVKMIWPSLILLTAMIGTISSALGACYLVMRLHGTAQNILKDDQIKKSEWVIFGILSAITVPTALGILYFAFVLMRASESGLSEFTG